MAQENNFDPLTGLPNMQFGRVQCSGYIDRIKAAGGEPAVLFFDIAGMRLYNSANGYDRGNTFLVSFATYLRNQFDGGLICRFSNDHFVVVSDVHGIEKKLEEIRNCVRRCISKISMDVYVGIYKIGPGEGFLESSEKAKLACNIQKKDGETFVRYYDEGLHKELMLRNYVASHIDEAISKGYIKVYYQPVVRTITETFCGMEALARWIDPKYGFLNPGAFIGALEESRRIHKLDCHIIELVCKEMREEIDQGHTVVPVSFNLSRLDFVGCDIFAVVEKTLKKYRIDREYIRVEITESLMVSDSYVRHEVERFRETGYEVWMDDFGSGYSSLNTLKDFEFDELKIDMVFLSNLSEVSQVIISSIVRMAKLLGLKTLAEGVETREQLEFLKGIGCEKVQGYYYGKPQPLKDALAHMESMGIAVEDHRLLSLYSELGRLDYLVDSPKSVMSYKDGNFKYLFVNKQYEEQLLSLGFANLDEVEKATNDPSNPVYYTLRGIENAAYNAPCEVTYVTHGVYVVLKGRLVADIDGNHIYDLSFRNTHVSAHGDTADGADKAISSKVKNILVADVNPQNLAFIESALRPDYHLLLANDGEQALKLLLEHGNNISLALIDADLPKMDGFKIIRRMQKNKRDFQVPFIVMTDNAELAKESIRLGAFQYILTPLKDRDMLRAKVDGAIKNSEFLHQMALNYMEYVPGGVVVFSAEEGEILYANATALDILDGDNVDELRSFAGKHFKHLILPEDYGKAYEKVREQIIKGNRTSIQTTYRVKTPKGNVKRIYHVGKMFFNTPYGRIYSVFISQDDLAMKDYFIRKSAFEEFMESGEATHTKSFEPGYKGFLFWNLTKNSPVLRMDGISYIPENLSEKYTYETHFGYLSSLMMKSEDNVRNALDYTRERLILDYLSKCMVHPLDITYNIEGYIFTIRSTFNMIMDPDSGDIILKLQNECVKTTKESD